MRRIRLRLPDATVEARLLDDLAPRTCERLWAVLPLTVTLRNSRWSGESTYAGVPALREVSHQASRTHLPLENPATFMCPGRLYVGAFTGGLGLPYGQAQSRDVGLNTWITEAAATLGDDRAFIAALARVRRAGATELTIERVA